MVQRAVVLRLEALVEPALHGCSQGFRTGHRQPQALHERREPCRTWPSAGRVEAEGRGCFDHLAWGPAAGVSPAAGQGGGQSETTRHGAPGGGTGVGRLDLPGARSTARRSARAHGVAGLPASRLGCLGCPRRAAPEEGPGLADARCRCWPQRRRAGSRGPPGEGGRAEAVGALPPDQASRQDGVDGVQEAAKSRAIGRGAGERRLARIDPLLGQDTPGRRGHQAQDGRETAAPVYASARDMVS
jgi:hypothetical protein